MSTLSKVMDRRTYEVVWVIDDSAEVAPRDGVKFVDLVDGVLGHLG